MTGLARIERPQVLPEVLEERPDEGGVTVELHVPESLAFFPGHFPDTPIVPGVVQIQWAMHFARVCLGLDLPFGHMEVIKFKELMQPGERLSLRIRYQPGALKLQFSFRDGEREFSSGRLYFLPSDV
jgi:3-hydroxymyristoyl/3-hydroxydecanoyl-(acyl carrier protein) dehydratase